MRIKWIFGISTLLICVLSLSLSQCFRSHSHNGILNAVMTPSNQITLIFAHCLRWCSGEHKLLCILDLNHFFTYVFQDSMLLLVSWNFFGFAYFRWLFAGSHNMIERLRLFTEWWNWKIISIVLIVPKPIK